MPILRRIQNMVEIQNQHTKKKKGSVFILIVKIIQKEIKKKIPLSIV